MLISPPLHCVAGNRNLQPRRAGAEDAEGEWGRGERPTANVQRPTFRGSGRGAQCRVQRAEWTADGSGSRKCLSPDLPLKK